jgi:hypothetical protein
MNRKSGEGTLLARIGQERIGSSFRFPSEKRLAGTDVGHCVQVEIYPRNDRGSANHLAAVLLGANKRQNSTTIKQTPDLVAIVQSS